MSPIPMMPMLAFSFVRSMLNLQTGCEKKEKQSNQIA